MTEADSVGQGIKPKPRKARWLRILQVILISYIVYDIVIAVSLPPRIAFYLWQHPDSRHRHIGWCGTPCQIMTTEFEVILFGAPAESIIPLLENRAPYLRDAVKKQLRHTLVISYPAIFAYYLTGNERIKLELIDLVKINPSRQEKQALLARIVENPRQPVFYEDIQILPNWEDYPDGQVPPVNERRPIDEIKFHLRLMRETDYSPDKAVAAWYLSQSGDFGQEAVPDIINLLNQPNEYIPTWGWQGGYNSSLHSSAILALGELGADSPEIIQKIETYYTGGDPELSLVAALTLYNLNYKKETILADLLHRLYIESNTETLSMIVNVLAQIGPDASDAVPRLIDLATNGDRTVMWSARNAINLIEGSSSISLGILIEQLKSPDDQLRNDAVMELQRINEYDVKAVAPEIFELLSNFEGEQKYYLCEALFNSGEYKKEVAIALAEMIDLEQEYWEYAASLLGRMGPDAIDVLPTLQRMIESQSRERIIHGVRAYIAVGGDKDYAVDVLLGKINSTNLTMASGVVYCLDYIGPDASKAIPALQQLRQTADRRLQAQIDRAIAHIEASPQE